MLCNSENPDAREKCTTLPPTHLPPGPRTSTWSRHFPLAMPIFTSQKNRTLLLLLRHIECTQCRVVLAFLTMLWNPDAGWILAAGACGAVVVVLITIDWNWISRSHTHRERHWHRIIKHTHTHQMQMRRDASLKFGCRLGRFSCDHLSNAVLRNCFTYRIITDNKTLLHYTTGVCYLDVCSSI